MKPAETRQRSRQSESVRSAILPDEGFDGDIDPIAAFRLRFLRTVVRRPLQTFDLPSELGAPEYQMWK
jgi:hypothetical protein